MERTKDEESKKLQSHNIHFDFHILIKIKELMVDVSSNCMEFALKVIRIRTCSSYFFVQITVPGFIVESE